MIVDSKIKGKYVGYYILDNDPNGTKIGLINKPNLFRRFLIKIILGWEWVSF